MPPTYCWVNILFIFFVPFSVFCFWLIIDTVNVSNNCAIDQDEQTKFFLEIALGILFNFNHNEPLNLEKTTLSAEINASA